MQFYTNLVVIHAFAGIHLAKSCFLIKTFSVTAAHENFPSVPEEFFQGVIIQTSPLLCFHVTPGVLTRRLCVSVLHGIFGRVKSF